MFLNEIDYPNRIIDAIKENRLVVFAGAGASTGAPTKLPNFENLAKSIAKGTEYKKSRNDSCEVFLGYLKSHGVDVNSMVAERLSKSCLLHNSEHEAIVNLFSDPQHIKIVTTNYDRMFEQYIDQIDANDVKVFDVPAIPLGNDISGIVHIHGIVDNPKYMVVTDEDFGKAYLTEGYASRFLTKLFDTYTVLFIGYSYKDTIVRYLTRAMSRNSRGNMYVLTDSETENWDNLGIRPIIFNKGDFKSMIESLEKLGQRAKFGLLEWKERLLEISERPSEDRTIDSEIEYCLECKERAQILANCIKGQKWVDYLEERNVFSRIFVDRKGLLDIDYVWIRWLCKNQIGIDDECFSRLLCAHGNRVSKEFADEIFNRICENDFPNDSFGRYILLCDDYLDKRHQIWHLISCAIEKGQSSIAKYLYKKLWKISILVERKYWIGDSEKIDYRHEFVGDVYLSRELWNKCSLCDNASSVKEFLVFFRDKIEELHMKYCSVGTASSTTEPWNLAMHVIEDREDNYHDDMLDYMVELMEQLCHSLEKIDAPFLRKYISDGLLTESIFGKKVFLKLLRVSSVFSEEESYMLIAEDCLFDFKAGKEQIFLLIKKIFNSLSDESKNHLINGIESIESKEPHNEYNKYNWCVWIKSFCDSNDRINQIEKDILSRNDFMPREHPELDMYVSSCSWGSDESPVSYDELKGYGVEVAFNKIVNYEDHQIRTRVNRDGLLNVFSKIVSDEFTWAVGALAKLNCGEYADDIWDSFFRGIHSGKYTYDEKIEMLKALNSGDYSVKRSLEIAELIWKIVTDKEYSDVHEKYDKYIFDQILVVWDNRVDQIVHLDRTIDLTLNSTVGLLLHSLIYIVSYYPVDFMPDEYKQFFEKALKIENWERKIAVCILAGHFNFFYFRDKVWTSEQFEKMLRGKQQDDFVPAWEGIVWFSSRLNSDVADAMSKIYLEAITHINWLSGEARKGMISLYLTLLIYVVSRPTEKYIPTFYKIASKHDRISFLEEIEHRLWNMEDDSQKKWWNSWLKTFFMNLQNKKLQVPSSEEANVLLQCVAKMKSIYGEAVEIIINGIIPKNLDSNFFYELSSQSNAFTDQHQMVKLIIKLMDDCDISKASFYLKEVISKLTDITDEEKRLLEERMLKHNISL